LVLCALLPAPLNPDRTVAATLDFRKSRLVD